MELEWELKNHEKFGQGVFATKIISRWAKILKTRSHVNVVEDEWLKSYCANCIKSFSCLSACAKCSIIRYCSDVCEAADSEYHKYECNWISSVIASISPNTTHLNLPSRSQRFLMRFIAYLILNNDDGSIDSCLVSNIDKIDAATVDSWRIEADEVLKMVPFLAAKFNAEKLIKFSAILKSNSYMIKNEQNGSCIGAQLIDSHSRVNHSCEPNCVSSYDGADVFLIALKDIQIGEEITVSYTDTSKPRSIRKSYLKQNLFFDCQCILCVSDEFSLPEALRTAVICNCGKEVFDLRETCPNCDASLEIISEAEGEELLKSFQLKSASEKLSEMRVFRNKFYESHWICNEAYDLILSEVSTDIDFARGIVSMLINLDNFNLSGAMTQFNPFLLLLRYEYIISIINLHPELHSIGVKLGSNYLPLAIKIKGIDDGLAQKIAYLIKKWLN